MVISFSSFELMLRLDSRSRGASSPTEQDVELPLSDLSILSTKKAVGIDTAHGFFLRIILSRRDHTPGSSLYQVK